MNKKCQFCNMKVKIPMRITIARGDGIGPEIMDATLRIITAAGCAIETDEIIVGQVPQKLRPVEFKQGLTNVTTTYEPNQPATKELVGVDVFICYANRNADELAARIQKSQFQSISLKMITNRGTKVWPGGFPETFCTDHWRCRFTSTNKGPILYADILELMESVHNQGLEIIKTENLFTFDGVPGFTAAQGQ